MNAKRNTLTDSLARALAEGPRPSFMAELFAHPVYCLASRITVGNFEALARNRAVSTRTLHWTALLTGIGPLQWLTVVCRSNLSMLLVKKLTRFRSECAVKCALKHAIAVLSRRHFVGLKDRAATCVSTLRGHGYSAVYSVAFHPSAPYLATGSWDSTAKLWLLNADCSAATCVSTLQGHNSYVTSVAFHASAPYLATGSGDHTAKLWLLNADCSAATCVSTLERHRDSVTSVAFHPSAPYLATGSRDNTAKLWR